MNKKILVAIMCVFLISVEVGSVVSAENIAMPAQLKDDTKDYEKDDATDPVVDEEVDGYYIKTSGPVAKAYSSVELEGGRNILRILIERNVKRKIIRLSAVLPFTIIPVRGINFTIEYIKDPAENDRFYYYTDYAGIVNESKVNETSIENSAHTITATNFTGIFIFTRGRVIAPLARPGAKFRKPAMFTFRGNCEELEVTVD